MEVWLPVCSSRDWMGVGFERRMDNTRMAADWNISLFHYRSHGAAYGRVLAGFEVDPQRSAAFDRDLAELGYSYVDETANPAVGQFL